MGCGIELLAIDFVSQIEDHSHPMHWHCYKCSESAQTSLLATRSVSRATWSSVDLPRPGNHSQIIASISTKQTYEV